ncbi:response regulator [bacterium]|nr:response regulator [bacterium]
MKTVLIIEDNDKNLYLLRFLIEKLGHRVIEARDGLNGVKVAMIEKPDVILMDIQLPAMDGYEATQEIRSMDSFRNVPIIAITSYAMEGDREKSLAAGCTDYIEKPIKPEQFIERIKSYL